MFRTKHSSLVKAIPVEVIAILIAIAHLITLLITLLFILLFIDY